MRRTRNLRGRRTKRNQRLLRGEVLERRNLLAAGFFSDSGQVLGNLDTHGVALGDLNGDGHLDAFTANNPSQVWFNNGSGVFAASSQTLAGSSSLGVELGDIDGDGDLDAVIAGPANNVWLNDGTGFFSNGGQSFGSDGAEQVRLGDLDGDGDLDVFEANHYLVNVRPSNKDTHHNRVWLNDGSGNFSDSGQLLGNDFSDDVALGDLDGDGDLDAFVANHGPATGGGPGSDYHPDKVWLNQGNGTFVDSGQEIGLPNDLAFLSHRVSLEDFDGDGDLDAFVVTGGNGDPNYNHKPDLLWLNDGMGVFTDSGQRLGQGRGRALATGDVDGDGDIDAFVTSPSSAQSQTVVWRNDGNGVFADDGQGLPPLSARVAALGDLDGDADLDLFVGTSTGDRVLFNGPPPAPMFSIDDVSVAEGDSGTTVATFTVTRSGDTGVAASVDYQTQDGSATAPDDYLALALTTLSFGAGETTKTIDVTVNGDTFDEGDHTFLVNLSNPSVGTSISDSQGIGTIQDDDAATVTMHVADLDATTSQGSRGKWNATVTITVVDAIGNPLAGVTVTGQWSSGASGSTTCTTDANGQCSVTKNNIKKNSQSVTFTVTNLVLANFTYDPNDNDDPDGDSDGTAILILKP